jgi:hypothetical protein
LPYWTTNVFSSSERRLIFQDGFLPRWAGFHGNDGYPALLFPIDPFFFDFSAISASLAVVPQSLVLVAFVFVVVFLFVAVEGGAASLCGEFFRIRAYGQ